MGRRGVIREQGLDHRTASSDSGAVVPTTRHLGDFARVGSGEVDLDVGQGLGVPEQSKSKGVPRDVDLRHADLLEQHPQEDLAFTVRGLVRAPRPLPNYRASFGQFREE